jgi:hypothetical protein
MRGLGGETHSEAEGLLWQCSKACAEPHTPASTPIGAVNRVFEGYGQAFSQDSTGNGDISPYVSEAMRSDCDTPLRLVLHQALMLWKAKSYIALCKAVSIGGLGTATKRRSVDMSKQNNAFANASKHPHTSGPQIANKPTITSTGTLAWNVRDIIFAPKREDTGNAEHRGSDPKTVVKE